MRADPDNLRILIGKVKKWLLCSRWRKAQWCALEVIKLKNKIIYRREALICIQKNLRMHQARKQHRPRYQGLLSIQNLQSQVNQIGLLSHNLKNKAEVDQAVDDLNVKINSAIQTIKSCERIKKTEIDKIYKTVVDQINKQLLGVKRKIEQEKIAEEQEKLRKLQLEMEAEKKRKQVEEEERKQFEEEKIQKVEMEKQRKLEEEEERRLEREERDRNQAEALQKQLEEANARYAALQQQIEQERRDHELALRLAAESGGAVDPLVIKRSEGGGSPEHVNGQHNKVVQENGKKHDLSKWKYAELRDTINTSCDIELLEGCREEFHRRLKVYHAWKAKNRKKSSTFNEAMRAPSSIMDEATRPGMATMKKSVTSCNQRYFRIPFVRPDGTRDSLGPADQSGRGWWYAHFDGQWIGRQMEVHEGRSPILLIAGRDDVHMCELNLDETGLTRKRGAEILESEFERDWKKNGGQTYTRPADRSRQ